MKTFDINRFWNLLKWDLLTNNKTYRNKTIGITVALAFLYCCNTWTNISSQMLDIDLDVHFDNLADLSIFMVFVAMYVGATSIFNNMNTKEQRIMFLMQPASMPEKFLVRFFLSTVGMFVIINVSLLMADLIHQLFCTMMGYNVKGFVMNYLPGMSNHIDSNRYTIDTENLSLNYCVLAALTMSHAFFIFSGSIFRRNAWLLALCCYFIIGFTVIILFTKLVEADYLQCFHFTIENPYVLLDILTVVEFTAAIAMYWLSYKIFTRMQVINNKWLNI